MSSTLDAETQNHYEPLQEVSLNAIWSLHFPLTFHLEYKVLQTRAGSKNSNFRSQKASLEFNIKLEFPGWKLLYDKETLRLSSDFEPGLPDHPAD